MRHDCDPNDTSVTRMRHEQHEDDISASQTTRVHKCDTTAKQVKNFDFDNGTSENIFSHPCISYMANERL